MMSIQGNRVRIFSSTAFAAHAAQHERVPGISLSQGPHRQHGEGQQVRHAGQADHRRRIAEKIEEDVHVERLVGGDRLVVAEIDGQSGVFQGPRQVERSQRHVQFPFHLFAEAHEEHVQVDQGDVG